MLFRLQLDSGLSVEMGLERVRGFRDACEMIFDGVAQVWAWPGAGLLWLYN